MIDTSLYEALNVDPSATADQIRAAYRALARKAHPDVGGDAEAFRKITEAYEILYDPESRAHYDATGQTREGSTLEDPLRKTAIQKITTALQKMFEDRTDRYTYADPFKAMRAETVNAKHTNAAKVRTCKDAIERATKAMERHKAKDGALNIGAYAMQGIISDAEAQLAACEKNEALFDKIIEIIDTQEFEIEEPPAVQMQRNLNNRQIDTTWSFYDRINQRF